MMNLQLKEILPISLSYISIIYISSQVILFVMYTCGKQNELQLKDSVQTSLLHEHTILFTMLIL